LTNVLKSEQTLLDYDNKRGQTMRTVDRIHEVSPLPLNAKDKEMARVAQRCIMASLDHSTAAVMTLTTDTGEYPEVELPPSALKLIGQILGAISDGRPIVLMPTEQEFTTVEAAHFLNVSRPFVIKEMDAGRLPHRKVGSHRRITFEDLLAYAQKMRATQSGALDRMAQNAHELGLDY
jgi:excisionase family DNA binding protein